MNPGGGENLPTRQGLIPQQVLNRVDAGSGDPGLSATNKLFQRGELQEENMKNP